VFPALFDIIVCLLICVSAASCVHQAYKAEFHIQLSVNNPSPTAFMQYDQDLRHAIIIAVVAFQSFIADIKTLIWSKQK
jgi:hypothetical protein